MEIESEDKLFVTPSMLHLFVQKMEAWQTGCEILLSELGSHVNDIKKRLVVLEDEINIIKLDRMTSAAKNMSKDGFPYKCPVCDGNGCVTGIDERNIKFGHQCSACEGKGIVWDKFN